jgi:hypothetical protein
MSASEASFFGKSEKSIADKLAYQLMQSSEELTQTLEKFTKARSSIIKSQQNAYATYRDELLNIVDLNDETIENSENIGVNEKIVDHNIMRHINAVNTSKLLENDYYEELNIKIEKEINVKQNVRIEDSKKKHKIPTFNEKKKTRELMFDLLDEAKIEEMKLVCLNLCNMFSFVLRNRLILILLMVIIFLILLLK